MVGTHGAIGRLFSAVRAEPKQFLFRVEVAVFARLPRKAFALVLGAVDPAGRRRQAINTLALFFVALVIATLVFRAQVEPDSTS
jgi:hypothetical protein